jgi:hypothetical protein
MTHTNSTLALETASSATGMAPGRHKVLARITAGGLLVAGGLLSVLHSLNGAVGIAVLVAVIAGVVGGVTMARPEIGYAAGAGLAALAALMGGFVIVGLFALAYAVLTAVSARRHARVRVIDLTAVS